MMYNRRYIIPGLVIFVVLATMPFWLNIGSARFSRPKLVLPEGENACIEPVDFMRTEHMRILNEWRDAAMRDGKRAYRSTTGDIWEISLQNTCMKCHTDKEQFCDTCHDANSVSPYCWDCHIAPAKTAPAAAKAKGNQP